MIGSLVGAGLSAVGSIFGGISASAAMRKVKKNLEAQKRENEAWYNRRYNEDATQRADTQRVLSQTAERMRSGMRDAAATAAVAGGTDELLAAQKAANAAALADATSRIAVAGENRKDNIESTYQSRDASLNSQLNNMETQRAAAIAQAAQGVMQAGSGIASAFDGGSLSDTITKAKV